MGIRRVGFFFRDFNRNGGVPKDVEGLANAIASNNVEVIVYSIGAGDRTINNDACVSVKNYKKSLLGYFKLFLDISKNIDQVELIHVFVLFIPVNFMVFLTAKVGNIPFVITPNCVLHKVVMDGKLFYSNKGVAWLGDQGSKLDEFFANKFSTVIKFKSRLLKKYYLNLFGKKMMRSADGIHYASEFEKTHSESYVGIKDSPPLIATWPSRVWVKDKKNDDSSSSYFEDNFDAAEKINIVFWSRIDYYYKGIDIIVESVRHASEECDINIVIYLIGPDYQHGIEKVLEYIQDNSLGEYIKIVDFETIYPKIAPLAQADANIVLSKCDGVLRTVRESLHLGVPQIISDGTQFADIVEGYDAGFVVAVDDKANAVLSLSKILIDISHDPKILSAMKPNALKAAASLGDTPISKAYISYYNDIVNKFN